MVEQLDLSNEAALLEGRMRNCPELTRDSCLQSYAWIYCDYPLAVGQQAKTCRFCEPRKKTECCQTHVVGVRDHLIAGKDIYHQQHFLVCVVGWRCRVGVSGGEVQVSETCGSLKKSHAEQSET